MNARLHLYGNRDEIFLHMEIQSRRDMGRHAFSASDPVGVRLHNNEDLIPENDENGTTVVVVDDKED